MNFIPTAQSLCRCWLWQSQQQRHESSEHGSARGNISWVANHFCEQMWLPLWNVEHRGRCHRAWRQVTPPSRLLLAAGHSITVIISAKQSSPVSLHTPLLQSHLPWPHHLSSHDTARVCVCVCFRVNVSLILRAFLCQVGNWDSWRV